jgi:hypothetical protein
MTYITKPIVDFAEVFNTGTNPRKYLKQLIGQKLGLYQNYIIINDNNIFFLLDEQTKDQIKSFDTIFLDLSQNPFLKEKVDQYKTLLDKPSQHLHVVVGDANFLNGCESEHNITYYYSSFFQTWYNNNDSTFDNIPTNKFSSLNSIPRIHRIIFINELFRQGMLDHVMLSFLYNMQAHHKSYVDTKYFLEDTTYHKLEYDFFKDNISQLCPILINGDPEYKKYVQDYSIESPAYNNTALNVITETTNDQHFFTEKTWKPIYAKQLFLMISSVGSIERLRHFGFDTYDDIIDHSYDNEPDLKKRIQMVVAEMKRLENNIIELHKQTVDRRYKNFFYLQSTEFDAKVNLVKCPVL